MRDQQLAAWFDGRQQQIEGHYLEGDNQYQQSGWGSTPDRWRLAREVVLEAVTHHGSFLDIGCANGCFWRVRCSG